MSSRLLRAGAISLSLLLSGTASATVVVSQTIEELTASAPVIVRGTVGQVQARWDDQVKRIWTYTELRVAEVLKGEAPRVLMVRQPGGELGGIGQRVSGAAKFTPGEEVLLFLDPAPGEHGVFNVCTLAAGKVAFERSRLGEVRAVRNLSGLSLYERTSDPRAPTLRVIERDDLGTREDLLRRVRHAVRTGVTK